MVLKSILDRFDGLNVRAKFLVGHAALIVPLAVFMMMAGFMSVQSLNLSKKINSDSMPSLQALEQLRDTGVRVVEATNTFALIAAASHAATAPPDRTANRVLDVQAARDRFAAAVTGFEALDDADGGGHRTFTQAITFARNDILRQSVRITQIAAAGATPAVLLELRNRFEASAAQFRNLIQAAVEAERTELTARQRQLMAWVSLSVVAGIGFSIVGIGVAIFGGLRVSARIARPIRRLRDAALRIGDGNLEAPDLPRTADEIGELMSAFCTMVERLKDSMTQLARQERLATLGQLAGTVSHDLRNPLGAIRNSLFSLRESVGAASTPGAIRLIDRIERNVVRCDGIVSDLLDYARHGETNRLPVDVDRWLEATLDEHLLPANITLRRDLNAGGAALLDQNRFRRVMINLLDNAAQAIVDPGWQSTLPPENVIHVRSAFAGPFLQISVSDTGPGIAPEVLGTIFEPLFTTKSFGIGLGLPMVQRIVQQHAGTIDVVSEIGKGSTFIIRVPHAPQQRERAA